MALTTVAAPASAPAISTSRSDNHHQNRSLGFHIIRRLVEDFSNSIALGYLLIDALLHPVQAWSSYFAKFKMVTFSTSTDVPDLSGKVIFVTGGNTGLGYEALKVLIHHKPAHIYLAARSAPKAEAAIKTLQETVPDVQITHVPLDLTSLESVRAAAQSFQDQSQRLDVLMLNAGIMSVPSGATKEGFEIQMGTNHFGHMLLTKLLLPTLQATAALPDGDARVITLTSEAHNMARTGKVLTSPSELEKCGTWVRYAYSKLANVLFAREMARRYPEITTVSIHPGIVTTDLWQVSQKSNWFTKIALAVGGRFRSTAEQGALNQIWASVVDKKSLKNGGYYTPVGTLAKGSPCAQNAALAEEFWDWSEKQLSEKGFA